jgi:hypothetical protein
MTDYRDEYTRMRVGHVNNRVADHNKWLDELHRRSVRRNDYATPEEQAGRIARPDQLLQERLGTPTLRSSR